MKNNGKYMIAACVMLSLTFGTTGYAGATLESGAETDLPDVTMAALIAANDIQSILSRHSSLLVEYMSADGDEIVYEYVDSDYLYQNFGEFGYLISKEEIWQYDEQYDEQMLYYYWFAMDDKEESEMRTTPSDIELIDHLYTSKETIESVQENGDGTLTVITLLNAGDTKENMESQQMEYPEGDVPAKQRTEYVVEKETLEIASISQSLVTGDEAEPLGSLKITFDADRPETLKTLTAQIDELKNDKNADERTATVIYDYGTDEEQAYEIKAKQGYMVTVITRDGYDDLYNDPEKTETYEGGDGVSDSTIYAFTEETEAAERREDAGDAE